MSDSTAVVTCFLRNGTDVLLLRRSDDVGSYPGQWGAVAGHAEGDPDAAAREEIAEETGLDEHVTFVRRGDPFPVEDADHAWRVHPYLFECDSRDVTTNYETAAFEWASPTAILDRETVPDLWESYRRVAPTVDTVRADSEHGSAFLSVRALEVLRDAAAAARAGRAGSDWDDLTALAREVLAARPGMAALRNRVNRALSAASEASPAALERAAADGVEAALAADAEAADAAADRLDDAETVATLSRSGTVLDALERTAPERVLLSESRPGGEGVGVAEALADDCAVTLTTDAALPGLVDDADAVLVGADTVLPDGRVVNKVGTYPLALAADRADVPVWVACARDKVSPDAVDYAEAGDPGDVYDGDVPLTVENPLFEATPPDLLAGVVTEDGVLDADGVASVARDHRSLADWT